MHQTFSSKSLKYTLGSSSHIRQPVNHRIVQFSLKTNWKVTFDIWFTSYELIEHTLQEHKLSSVRVLRKNKRKIPLEFLKFHEVNICAYTKTTLVFIYVNKTKLLYWCYACIMKTLLVVQQVKTKKRKSTSTKSDQV